MWSIRCGPLHRDGFVRAHQHTHQLYNYTILLIIFFLDFQLREKKAHTLTIRKHFCKWYQTFSVYNLFFSLCCSSHLICAISVVASKKKENGPKKKYTHRHWVLMCFYYHKFVAVIQSVLSRSFQINQIKSPIVCMFFFLVFCFLLFNFIHSFKLVLKEWKISEVFRCAGINIWNEMKCKTNVLFCVIKNGNSTHKSLPYHSIGRR